MMNNDFKVQTEKATRAIINRLKLANRENLSESVIAAAYILYLLGEQHYATLDLDNIIANDELAAAKKEFLRNYIDEELWNAMLPLSKEYAPDIFKEIVLIYENTGKEQPDTSTPESVAKLARQILDIQNIDAVADLCSGNGKFLLDAAVNVHGASYSAYDISPACKEITDIRAALLGVHIKTETVDVFELAERQQAIRYYDKLFSNYPINLPRRVINKTKAALDFMETLTDVNPYMFPETSTDWVYNSLLLRLMKEEGKAAAIMTNSACFNNINLQARRYFVDNGFIEAVIALPPRLFNSHNIPVTMIVFSLHNSTVRLVDATKMYTEGRRTNELSKDNIKEILNAYRNDTENSILIGNDELKVNKYALSPQRFLVKNIKFENAQRFENVIKKIKRSSPLTAAALDRLASSEETNIKYLRVQDIQDGIINSSLPSIKTLEPRQSQYLLKNGDLLIGKIGFPYKVAVAKIEQGQAIIPVGNMYALELDTEKVNPYYIKAFLESKTGSAVLQSASIEGQLPVISVDSLKIMEIPVPDMAEQNKIADEYLAAIEEVQILRKKLEKAVSRLGNIFDSRK